VKSRRTNLDLSIGSEPNADMRVQALEGNINIKELYP
jgi:hypothetical protein